MPRTSRGRSNPVEEKELEYEIYGWFRFEDDAEDVKRLGRRWVPVAMLAEYVDDWEEQLEQHEEELFSLRMAAVALLGSS